MSGKTSNAVKQRWNTEHYTQIKVSVKPDVAGAFKKACETSGTSMASELSIFMQEFASLPQQPNVTHIELLSHKPIMIIAIIIKSSHLINYRFVIKVIGKFPARKQPVKIHLKLIQFKVFGMKILTLCGLSSYLI